jgi:two-component system phosphate regulon sensor histidine kinase PhoR
VPERSPTPLAIAWLTLVLLAVWIIVAAGDELLWFGIVTSLWVTGGWWLMHRQARLLRSRATMLEGVLEQAASVAGKPGTETGAIGGLIRQQLNAAGEEIRALRAVLDAVEEPVLVLDAGGDVVAANRGAMSLLAPEPSRAVVGEPLDQLLPDERVLVAVRAAGVGVESEGAAANARATLPTEAGPRIVEVAAEPIGGGPFGVAKPPRVVVTLRDVTEQAVASQLKTDFVANASHELRTPLASIRTAAETLGRIGGDDEAMRERLVSIVGSNAERLEELSRDMLDLSSLESNEAACVIERVDLTEIAAGLAELFAEPRAGRRVRLEFDLDDRLRAVWTDSRLVRLVLRNLVDNAIKFANEGSVVRVRGVVLPAPEDAGTDARLAARFEVIDRGMGIPIAQQQRVFERFFQGDAARTGSPRRRGTGLGLAIVKHALRTLDGSIRVESVWQQGTTMTVELPGCVEVR